MDTLGERVKEIRKQRGMTREKLASLVKVPIYKDGFVVTYRIASSSSIRSIEHNANRPNVDFLYAVSLALAVPIEWLLVGDTFISEDKAPFTQSEWEEYKKPLVNSLEEVISKLKSTRHF
ncbi:hypothetical protein ABE82_26205 (plasmid) [Paenibacillus peoriae]|uniref:helix-turn-helix domain-containing protein n=1 Tax=Paenibacillus peoriae TaxID=59893 RepID=UPI0007211772|nr:helix-turn-helix transcriptional regulator [Paenibacillus peoriae]ALS09915.1 hypothetical protein ABE82_26205 [Paenibacillus peoriae]